MFNYLLKFFIIFKMNKLTILFFKLFNILIKEDNWFILYSSEQGYYNLVNFFLEYEYFKKSEKLNEAFILACRNGHFDIVKLFLNNTMVDPSSSYNSAILAASKNSHFDIVEYLLNDKRVDPSVRNCTIFLQCVEKNQNHLVKKLTKDLRIIPNIQEQKALTISFQNCNMELIHYFCNMSNIFDVSKNNSIIFFDFLYSILVNMENKKLNDIKNIVIFLLNTKADPSKTITNSYSILFAICKICEYYNDYEILSLFLQDKRLLYSKEIDYTIINNFKKNSNILSLLSQESLFIEKIDRSSKEWEIIHKYVMKKRINNF